MLTIHPLSLCTWIDDKTVHHREAVTNFQRLWLSGQPQMHPMLDRMVELLMEIRQHWDPICADIITNGTFYFVDGTLLETHSDWPCIQLKGPSYLWPSWFRWTTAIGVYACFLFPKSVCEDLTKFIHTIPELDRWNAYADDILS
jgi:hypothetical protein